MKKMMKVSVVMGFIFALLFSTYSTAEARSYSSRSGGSSFHSSSTSKSYSKPSTSTKSTSTKITLSKSKTSSTSTKTKPKASKPKTKVTSSSTKTSAPIVASTTTNKKAKKKNKYPRTIKVSYTFAKGSEGYGKGKYYAFDITMDDLDIIPLKKNKSKEYYLNIDEEKQKVTVGKNNDYPNYVYAKKRKGTFKMTFKSKREYTIFKKEMKDKDNPMTLKIK